MNVLSRFALLMLLSLPNVLTAQDFLLVANGKPVQIIYGKSGPKLDSICAHLLAADIGRVTDHQPQVITDLSKAKGQVIVIGNIQSELVQTFVDKSAPLHTNLLGKWECFARKVTNQPTANIAKAYIIAGSDARGTAYGVFALSEKIGVSPWYWWADVPVKKQANLIIHQPDYISLAPSV